MKTIVLNEQTNSTTLQELLASAGGQEIQIRDESGRLVARFVPEVGMHADVSLAIAWADANIDDICRVRHGNDGESVTTSELVARVRALKQARCQASDESMAEAEANIDEIRRRMESSREHDITTKELLARLRALAPE